MSKAKKAMAKARLVLQSDYGPIHEARKAKSLQWRSSPEGLAEYRMLIIWLKAILELEQSIEALDKLESES